ANSLTGNNQPLFIVDGIPVDNSSNRLGGFGGVDYGNAAQDINPSDVESISVLKGPNAAALYGSRAANGAIIVTTKSGKSARGLGISASQNVSFEDPLRLPSYQNQYGQGSGGKFSYVDGDYGGVNDGTDESWGPQLDGRLLPQFFSNGQPVPWVASPNNVRNFFETGRTSTTNVALATSSDQANVRLSATRMAQDGIYPGFGLDRTTLSLHGGSNLTERLNADASVQYIASDGHNRPGTGYAGDNPMLQFVWFGRQVDTGLLRSARRNEDGTMFNWNRSYHSNPYWIALENVNNDSRDRIIGSVSTSYELTDWLSGTLRSGTDWYQDRRKRTYAAGSYGISPGPNRESVGSNGTFDETVLFNQETNTEFMLTGQRQLTDRLGMNMILGGNRRDVRFNRNYAFVQNLTAPDVFALANASVTPFVRDYTERKRVNSLLGQASFDFNNYLFMDVTGRNDWSSTLPEGSNSYFYPSVAGSFVFTDAVPSLSMNGMLSFGKLRAAWARVGNDADPYLLASVYGDALPFDGQPGFEVSNSISNASLKPEQTTGVEVGGELRFFGNRLGLDATYYARETTDQILPVQISPTTGFQSRVINAGKISNRGFELQADVVPVRLDNGFEWEVVANYARNSNEVVDLDGDLATLVLGNYWSLTVEARKGEPYGALVGFGYARHPDGSIMVSASGRPVRDPVKRVLGNYNPDWTGSLSNRLRYGPVDFSFLFDTKQGGELFSMTQTFGRYAGVLAETLEGREVDWNNPGYVVQGKKADGSVNTTVITAEQYNHSLYGNHEAAILDASFVKLREVALGIDVPSSYSRRLGISGMNVSLVGRNLWLNTENPHLDPETAFDASNVQGIEFGQLPSVRSIGFNVVVTP
ncbi:MAG: SusC/RagA family TonB-linked outer membrane protein, partial [Actinomycetota bacterium]|nr:SusC/RagA family TonB-linked outer membrane protein [Actinomycetota bacterium]